MLNSLRAKIPFHLFVAFSSWVGRAIVALSALVAIRLMLSQLSTESYAIIAVLQSLVAWFALVDFGIGNATQNFISEHRAHDREYYESVKACVLTSLGFLALSIPVVILLGSIFSSQIFQNITQHSPADLIKYFIVAGLIYVTTNIATIVHKIWYAEDKGYLANISLAISALIGLSSLAFLPYFEDKVLGVLILYNSPNLLVPLYFFIRRGLAGAVLKARIGWPAVQKLLRRSSQFFLFGLFSAAVLQVDYLVLAHAVSADAIVEYNLGAKIFSLIFMVYGVVLIALWPEITRSLAKGNWASVQKQIRRHILWGEIYMLTGTGIAYWFLTYHLDLLTSIHGHVHISGSMIVLFGLYYAIRIWADTYSVALLGKSDLSAFWIALPLQAVLGLCGQLYFSSRFGVNGILLGLILSFVLTVAWILPWQWSRLHLEGSAK